MGRPALADHGSLSSTQYVICGNTHIVRQAEQRPVRQVPAPCFEVCEELATATVLHDKVHTLLILEARQQLDNKGKLH